MQPAIQRPLSLLGAVLFGLLGLLYLPLLLHWADGWINKSISIEHEYFSHGLIGLPFAVFLAWEKRDRWLQLSFAQSATSSERFAIASGFGLVLLLLGVACYFSNLADLINLSLPICLSGLCLWLKGLAGLRLQAFPLLLVWLATPTEIPYLIAPYTLPLQSFIAGTAAFILLQFGLNVEVNQIYLLVNDRIVEVAPYCAGLKMLFTSLYVGLMLLYWTGAWRSRSVPGTVSRVTTITFFVGIVLTSTIANIIRNTLLAFLHGTGRDRAFDWLHAGWGGDVYSAAMLGLLVLLLKAIEHQTAETNG